MKRARKRWNRDEVLKGIAALKAKGEKLNYGRIVRRYPRLAYAGMQYFGGWKNAIEAAGLDYDKIRIDRTWSRAAVIERILALKKAGKPLSYSDAQTSYGGLMVAATIYCGSWAGAIKAAGLDYKKIKRLTKWSKPFIAAEIRRMRREGIDFSTTVQVRAEYRTLYAAASRYYGSWAAAMEAAGLAKLRREKR